MLDGRIARPPSWSLDPGSPFGGPGPGRVGAGCCHGCRPTGPTGVAGGGWGSPEVAGRMNRRLPEVAHRRRGAAPCARLSCRMRIPVALAARAGVSTSPGGPRSGPGCPDSRSGRDIRRRSRMPCQWPRPIDPGQGYGGLRMTWSVSRRYAVLAPGSLPGDFTLAELLDRWHLDHADSGPAEAVVSRMCRTSTDA